MSFQPGYMVEIYGAPDFYLALVKRSNGEQGIVKAVCRCLEANTVVIFGEGQKCIFDKYLKKIPGYHDYDKLADWKDIPKPWEKSLAKV